MVATPRESKIAMKKNIFGLMDTHYFRLLFAAILSLAIWCAFVFTEILPQSVRVAISAMGAFFVFCYGAYLAFKIARGMDDNPRSQLAWRLLGAMQGIYACGELAWSQLEIVYGRDPTYSWVNLLYFLTYPFIFAALLVLPRHFRSKKDRTLFILDTLIIAVVTGLVIVFLVLLPALTELPAETDAMQWIVTIGYPLADMLTLVGVASCLLRLPIGSERLVMQWLALGMGLNFLGDSTWIYESALEEFDVDGISAAFWFATAWAWVLSGAAKLHRSEESNKNNSTLRWNPGINLLAGLVMFGLAYIAWNIQAANDLRYSAIALSLILGLIMLRQLLAEKDLAELSNEKLERISSARIGAIVRHAVDALFVLDREFRVQYATPGAEKILGEKVQQFIGQPLIEWIHQDDDTLVTYDLNKVCNNAMRGYNTSWRMRNRRDQWLWTEAILSNLFDEPSVNGLVISIRDVTEQQELETKLRYMALHDALTALPNRGLFEDRLTHQLAVLARGKRKVAVLFIDLDHFKLVNDGLGHQVGDQVLKQVADRIEISLYGRERDRAGRLGGDEFVVSAEYVDAEEVIRLAEKIRVSLAMPYPIEPHVVNISACIGIAYARTKDRAEDVLHHADLAMFEAKRHGRNAIQVYDPEHYAKLINHIELQNQIKAALQNNALSVAYQPIVEASTGQVYGVEALLRWLDPRRPQVDMETLIREAENCGVIVPLGHWVLATALRDIGPLIRTGALSSVTVNLSWRQLEHENLPDEVDALLKSEALPASRLVLEVTESGHLNPERAHHEMLMRLHQRGVRLALDDFGTGESSISTLQFVPMNVLKIPKHCVDELEKPAASMRLVEALLGLANRMEMNVVAEGVETEKQFHALRDVGCSFLQGFHFARAMPIDDLRHWIDNRRALNEASK